jgi:hypothetical protein
MTVSVGSTITTSSYNLIFENISKILNSTVGGYGSGIRASSTATTNIVASANHWDALYSDVNKCIKHQTGSDIPDLTPPTQGNLIYADFVNTLASAATTAVANSLTVHASQLATSVSSTNHINTGWDSEVQIERAYNWGNARRPHYHFNLGGYIISTIDSAGTVSSIQDQSFVNFVNHAKAPYSKLITDPYTRSRWLAYSTTSTSYSTNTNSGVFTATITYTKNSNTVTVVSSITPPVSVSTITVTPISVETLYYSTDAISAVRPALVEDRKILQVGSLEPFTFSAGQRSAPQYLKLSNVGAEPVTISSIFATSLGVSGYALSTATNLSEESPFNIPVTLPLTLAANKEYDVLVYYYEPVESTTEIGTFYNSILITSDADDQTVVVSTVQNVTAPEFDFDIALVDLASLYTYDDWAEEYNLSSSDKTLGINIANTYYLPNTNFGVIDGVQRYALYRKPDAAGLNFWVSYIKTNYGGVYNSAAVKQVFFQSVDATSDSVRSRTSNKFYNEGYGYGDFYDKTLINYSVTSSVPKLFNYTITPRFGTLRRTLSNPGYDASISNQEFEGAPSTEAVNAFQLFPTAQNVLKGPSVQFSPLQVNNLGTYSVDLTITVYATDLTGTNVSVTKTVNLTLEVDSLADGNLVKWTSAFESNNAVMGMSYDRIGGKLHLTIGVGSGADGAPTLSANNYNASYVNTDQLGITGDEQWGTFDKDFGDPMYRISYGSSWGTFINTYGVWPVNPSWNGYNSYPYSNTFLIRQYKFTANSTGNYTVEWAADDSGYVEIDGSRVIERLSVTGDNFKRSWTSVVNLPAGEHTIKLGFRNIPGGSGNPGGVATTIKNPAGNIVWSTLNTVRSTIPYAYWPEVYRIPIEPNVAKTYQIANYLVKNFYPVFVSASNFSNYGAYFGTAGTSSAGSILSIDSDGKGNLTFIWNGKTTTSGTAEDATLAGITQLPIYYSYLPSRKTNLGAGGANTLKLIGMTTIGVRTATVKTPGYNNVNIAVIDEADDVSALTLQTDWNTYLVNHPRDKLYLLQPGGPGRGSLREPSNFTSSNLGVGPIAVNRDIGRVGSRSDWFALCGLAEYPAGTQVKISVDGSGSMTFYTVEASYNYFIERCAAAGFTVTAVGMDGENWISPFKNPTVTAVSLPPVVDNGPYN